MIVLVYQNTLSVKIKLYIKMIVLVKNIQIFIL